MKKTIKNLAFLALAAFGIYSCKPADEVKPNASKPNVTVTFDKNYGIQKNFDVSTTVSEQGDTAFINITAGSTSSTDEMGAIYIMYQKDDNKAEKFKTQPNGSSIPSAGYQGTDLSGGNPEKFNFAGNDYTFNIPSARNKQFKLTIPILLRNTTSKADVFTIWITKNGKAGRFDNPAKNLGYGVATVTLNYTPEKLVSYYETVLGNSDDTTGSLFSTKFGTNFKRQEANADTAIGNNIDFLYNTTGTGSSLKYLFGSPRKSDNTVDATLCAGFDIDGKDEILGTSDDGFLNIINFTKVAKSNSTFSNINGEASLVAAVDAVISSTTTDNSVSYDSSPTNQVIAFVTKKGKKGLILIKSATGDNTTAGQASIEVKVQR